MSERTARRARITVLFNPSAGGGRALKSRDRLTALFRAHNIPWDFHLTESEAHLRALAREKGRSAGTLAAVGGDSTFQIVAEEIVRAGSLARLAMFGLGSSNDIPREFGLESAETTLAALAAGRSRRIDLGRVEAEGTEARIFIGQASLGLGVFVNQAAARLAARRPGLARFQAAVGAWGAAAAFRKKLVPVALSVGAEGARVEGHFQVATFSNIRYWATGRKLIPHALPDDGRLDACLIRDGSFLRLARLAAAAGKGGHVRAAGVEFLRSPLFEIVSPAPLAVQVDGEVLGGPAAPLLFRSLRVRVLPAALTICA